MEIAEPKTAILTSGDGFSASLLNPLKETFPALIVLEDHSLTVRKLIKLIFKGRVQLGWLAVQAWTAMQCNRVTGSKKLKSDGIIHNNLELASQLNSRGVKRLITFRASLIVSKAIIEKWDCYNVHSATLPKYGGLAAIARALKAQDYVQEASLQTMAPEVDKGQVLKTKRYELNPQKKRWDNEIVAYRAGLEVLLQFLVRET